MPQDVAITVKNMLWDNWATSNPNSDTVKETFLPTLVHFTTREFATNPRRIHSYQISVFSKPLKETPEEVGSIVTYKVEESVEIHVWAIAGIGSDFETVRQRAKNMMDSVDIILRLGAVSASSAALGIQFLRISPGWLSPRDDVNTRTVFHRVKEAVAIYYRTETQLPDGFPIVNPTFGVLKADIGLADQSSAG